MIPRAIRTRLYVTLSDQNWAKRVASGVAGVPPGERQAPIEPYELTRHPIPNGVIIELRPRAGTWYPCIAMVPISQQDLFLDAFVSPSGSIPMVRKGVGVRSGRDKRGFFRGVEQKQTLAPACFSNFKQSHNGLSPVRLAEPK